MKSVTNKYKKICKRRKYLLKIAQRKHKPLLKLFLKKKTRFFPFYDFIEKSNMSLSGLIDLAIKENAQVERH